MIRTNKYKCSDTLLAGSRLLSLISIANHLEEVITVTHHLTVDNHPRDPFVVSRGLISSNQMESRSFSTLSTRKNHLSIHSSSDSALLNTLVREIDRSLLTKNERPPLLGVVLLRAKLHIVSIALFIAMLALEGGRIATNDMSISVRNKLQVSNGHQILSLMKLHEIVGDERLATRAIGLEIQRSLNFIGLKSKNYAKILTAEAAAINARATIRILESIRKNLCGNPNISMKKTRS